MRPSGDRPDRVRHVTFTTPPTTNPAAGDEPDVGTAKTTTTTPKKHAVEKVAAALCPEFVELGLGEPASDGMSAVEDLPAPATPTAAGATGAAAPSPRRLHDPPTHHDVTNSSHRGVPPPAITTPPHPVEARARGGGGGGGARGGDGGGRVLLVPVDGLRRGLAMFPLQLNFPENSPKTNQRYSSLCKGMHVLDRGVRHETNLLLQWAAANMHRPGDTLLLLHVMPDRRSAGASTPPLITST